MNQQCVSSYHPGLQASCLCIAMHTSKLKISVFIHPDIDKSFNIRNRNQTEAYFHPTQLAHVLRKSLLMFFFFLTNMTIENTDCCSQNDIIANCAQNTVSLIKSHIKFDQFNMRPLKYEFSCVNCGFHMIVLVR